MVEIIAATKRCILICYKEFFFSLLLLVFSAIHIFSPKYFRVDDENDEIFLALYKYNDEFAQRNDRYYRAKVHHYKEESMWLLLAT